MFTTSSELTQFCHLITHLEYPTGDVPLHEKRLGTLEHDNLKNAYLASVLRKTSAPTSSIRRRRLQSSTMCLHREMKVLIAMVVLEETFGNARLLLLLFVILSTAMHEIAITNDLSSSY